jgi:hypothetical protein
LPKANRQSNSVATKNILHTYQKSQFGYIWVNGKCWYIFGSFVIFHGHWKILWSFGIFVPFGSFNQEKIWQTCCLMCLPNEFSNYRVQIFIKSY